MLFAGEEQPNKLTILKEINLLNVQIGFLFSWVREVQFVRE
jgi:hypothetical protein